MARIIGMPQIEIDFRYAGATAVQRGEKGQMILVVKEEKEGNAFVRLRSITDFTKEVRETFSENNIRYIEESLAELPREVVVLRLNEGGNTIEEDTEGKVFESVTDLSEIFEVIGSVANRNCWITVADQTKEDTKALITFIKSENKFNKKRYKAVVYQGEEPDDMHIVNFTTEEFILKGDDNQLESGLKLVPRITAALAGQPFDTSIIARTFGDIDYVTQPAAMDEAVDKGELFLYNDEGDIRVGRGVNSLVTLEQNMSNDMKFIVIVEQMDLIFSDIYTTWNNGYKGRYKNNLDNQMLLVSALKAYLGGLEQDQILDIAYDNDVEINVGAQRLANMPIYGAEEVEGWNDGQVMERTVGTNVYLRFQLKMLNTMEDIFIDIMI